MQEFWLRSYLSSSKKILDEYRGTIPFASWLKDYFRQNKKFGSKDRKIISQLCYSYFRLGKSFNALPDEEKVITSLFLTSTEPHPLLAALRPEWNNNIHLSVEEKLSLLKASAEAHYIFPFSEALSPDINAEAFHLFHLLQPNLYLRLRPGKEEKVAAQLYESGIVFEKITRDCLLLINSAKASEVLMLNTDAVVQDINSQKVLDILPQEIFQKRLSAWDCCAASGGKSILLYDKNPRIELTVSDIRENIIINLKKRFAEAGMHRYKSFVADITKSNVPLPINKESFDLIICDAPCSGSGTWGRTPEQLVFFTKEKIDHYANLQRSIAQNAAAYLKKGGFFLYITCSVYKKENEEVVTFLQQHTGLQLQSMQYFKGYHQKADTLFAAAFRL
jgi:16S rRNA (cytosine967-C5)-methyltransferase